VNPDSNAPVARRRGRPPGNAPATSAGALLATAEQLIRSEGPAVTLSDIAAAAGVTKPIVYHHVGNKDALIRALAERLADRISAAVEAATAHTRSPRDGVSRFLETYLDVVHRDQHILIYVSGGGSGTDHVAESLRLADRSAQPIAQRFAAFREEQGADPGVATTWAYAVIGMLHFVTLSWIRDPQLTAAELADQLGELLWSGLGSEV
jgi:AcrR family transcriptional regulator